MATEKTFSRINAGKSMLFLGRLIPSKSFPAQSPNLFLLIQPAMIAGATVSSSGLVFARLRSSRVKPDP